MAVSDNFSEWTVLVVEDDPDHLLLAKMALASTGVTVHAVSSAADAMRLLAKMEPPTLILLDIDMPIVNGWQALEQIRAKTNLAKVPVVAVTAHSMSGDKERALEAGFDGYIPKPYDFVTLSNTIKESLAGGKD